MSIKRAVPDVQSEDIEATRSFYADLLGFHVSMEVGKFLLFSSPTNPDVQVSVNETPDGVPVHPGFMVDVGSAELVRALHDEAVARGLEVFEPIDDKPWGIRRFGMFDPNGVRVTVLSHID